MYSTQHMYHTHIYIHIHRHTETDIQVQTDRQRHIKTQTHTQTQTQTHTHTQIHIHIAQQLYSIYIYSYLHILQLQVKVGSPLYDASLNPIVAIVHFVVTHGDIQLHQKTLTFPVNAKSNSKLTFVPVAILHRLNKVHSVQQNRFHKYI